MRSLQMQYLNVTLLCEAGKKKLQNFILTQEQRVLVIRNTILTEWS